jgi:ABC-type branched-subunit amino acid transport system substrate-binding protein
MNIINLTQHQATQAQATEGVIEPQNKAMITALLTFEEIPSRFAMLERANTLAVMAKRSGCDAAMVGGAPYFMGPLCDALKEQGVKPLFSFTERKSMEVTNQDGTVTKTAVFAHVGWVEG